MKLGMIAMSGVRAQNAELNALGLTLPGFVERSRVIASLPSLGLLTLAGMAPSPFDVHYVELPELGPDGAVPGEFDVVAISSFSAQIKEAYALADRYRRLGTKVVLGGLHVSSVPDEAAAHADAIVLGEGEIGWPALLEDLAAGPSRLKPVYDGRSRNFDLAESPMPRFELLDPESYNRLTVQTQRGCPFRCEFCAASLLISPRYKQKPVERVIAEIRRIKEIWPRPFIEFADDNSFASHGYSRRLLRALAHEEIRWFTETDVSVAEDAELLELMRESGCAQVLIGFESPSIGPLNGVEKRSNWKAKQMPRYREAIAAIQERGIAVNGCFVLGLDGAGPEVFDEVFEFVRDSGLYEVQITVQTPFPGTPLYERLRSEGRILQEGAWEMCTLFDVNYRPSGMTVAELEAGLRYLGARLYSEEFKEERRARFRQHARTGWKNRNAETVPCA